MRFEVMWSEEIGACTAILSFGTSRYIGNKDFFSYGTVLRGSQALSIYVDVPKDGS